MDSYTIRTTVVKNVNIDFNDSHYKLNFKKDGIF